MTTPIHADRRALLLGGLATLSAAGQASAATAYPIMVYKTPTCGCCTKWVQALGRTGFRPTVTVIDDLAPIRRRLGVPDALASCHTAHIRNYAVEGHVPPADILRLMKEMPTAVGLAVPGMPAGSPGMEMPGVKPEPFVTLLILDRKGRSRPFARHG